jgi:polysaccharide biosynthesis/export protein
MACTPRGWRNGAPPKDRALQYNRASRVPGRPRLTKFISRAVGADLRAIGILMRTMRTLLLAAIAIFAAVVTRSPPATAQVAAPSEEQLELLRSLSPEQREALLRQVVGGSGADASGSRRDRTEGVDRERTDRDEQRRPQDLTSGRPKTDSEELRDGVPVLKGDDSVIIKIDLPPENPALGGVTPPVNVPGGGAVPGTAVGADELKRPPGPGTAAAARQRTPELGQEERERREKLVDLVRSRNPYRLSSEGVLQLPGFARIPLAGLTEFEATVRLQADPELRDFDVNLIRLPLRKIGVEALKPFGYDLFERAPSTFAPVTNVPIPEDYVVGAGDEFEVQLYGNQNRTLRLTVGRDGRINFPELGPISVGGQRFTSVKETIEARVERQMIGVHASVSIGDTRSIRVFVLGEANRPGSYTISGFGTITSALFAAGGVKPIGSLRNIQLKRQGTVVRNFDLYDMLIRGDSTDDARLLPGDVVFVPPLGPTITVHGEVRRPAIYEAREQSTVSDVVALAGGLTAEADTSKASLTRIDENRQRVVMTVELATAGSPSLSVRNGDLLQVTRLKPTLDSGVVVEGHVHSPATYAFRDGLRLSQVIRSIDELKPNADINYVLIRRELPPSRQIAVVSADLDRALREPGTPADVMLMPRDRIIVFDLETSRDRIIRPLLNELRTQAHFSQPSEVVTIDGKVKVPGEYPLEPGMRVSDLIRAGGSLGDAAYGGKAELTRYRVVNGDSRRTEQLEIDLVAVMGGDLAANVLLQPFDSLSIREMPEWGSQEHVMLVGELRFPGRYSIKRGETLKSVLARAGGLTELAFAEGSVFTREELKQREQKQLDVLATRLQNDLATLALQGAAANQAQAGAALTVGQALLTQVRASEAVGRLVIDLPRTVRGAAGTGSDIILRDGDRLIVPKFQQEVTVIGEVQTATSHVYLPELTRDDYISLSGGMTKRADHDKVYVVRANGSVVANEGGRWFSRGSTEIKPGDTVVVPVDTERLPALPFWQAVTQIIYYLAVSTAAVTSF